MGQARSDVWGQPSFGDQQSATHQPAVGPEGGARFRALVERVCQQAQQQVDRRPSTGDVVLQVRVEPFVAQVDVWRSRPGWLPVRRHPARTARPADPGAARSDLAASGCERASSAGASWPAIRRRRLLRCTARGTDRGRVRQIRALTLDGQSQAQVEPEQAGRSSRGPAGVVLGVGSRVSGSVGNCSILDVAKNETNDARNVSEAQRPPRCDVGYLTLHQPAGASATEHAHHEGVVLTRL